MEAKAIEASKRAVSPVRIDAYHQVPGRCFLDVDRYFEGLHIIRRVKIVRPST